MGNRRVILFLLLGISVCTVLLTHVDVLVAWSSMSAVQETNKLVPHSLDTVQEMTIERTGLYAGLRRRAPDGAWELFSPFPSRVDQSLVARMLDAIEQARITDRIRSADMRRRELSLRDFGFSPATVCISLQENGRNETLFLGATAPTGKEVYVRVASLADQVMSVPVGLLESVPKALDEIRSRDMVTCDRSRVRILEFKAQGKPFVRLSKETGTWRLIQPMDAPADDRKVAQMLEALYAVQASQFVWPSGVRPEEAAVSDSALKTRLELYGLGTDMLLQISAQESAVSEPSRLIVGNAVEGGEGLRYVLMPGGQAIAAVSNSFVQAFQCTPEDLRDMRLFFVRPDNVNRLEVTVEGALYVLAQQQGVWQVVSPIAGRADQAYVTDMLEQLLRLTATEILAVTNQTATLQKLPSDMTDGRSRVDVMTVDGKNVKLLFSPEYMDGKTYYAVNKTDVTTTVFRVGGGAVPAALIQSSSALAVYDKTIFAFTNNSIQRISVRRPAGNVETVCRDKEGVWRAENTNGVVVTAELTRCLALLAKLSADRIEKPCAMPNELDAYGLKTPWIEVSVSVEAGDAIRKTILVGGETSEGARYGMIRGQDLVFVLDAKTVSQLSQPLIRAP